MALLAWQEQGSLEQVMGAGRAVPSRLAEHPQPSGLFLARCHHRFIGFLILVLFSKDR